MIMYNVSNETLKKSNLGTWKPGYEVNLERSMKMEGRIDGHNIAHVAAREPQVAQPVPSGRNRRSRAQSHTTHIQGIREHAVCRWLGDDHARRQIEVVEELEDRSQLGDRIVGHR